MNQIAFEKIHQRFKDFSKITDLGKSIDHFKNTRSMIKEFGGELKIEAIPGTNRVDVIVSFPMENKEVRQIQIDIALNTFR